MNFLVKSGANVNALDEILRSPLHYAAEANKVGVLCLLIENGGKISLRDEQKRMTVYQLASNERTRKVIVTYSSPPYKTKPEDIEYLNAVLGDQHALRKAAKKSLANTRKTELFNFMDKDEGVPISDTLRRYQEQLFKLLTRIQEYGIASYQHVKKPSLFSGNWMEEVQNVDDLINVISNISANEAILRVFNILSPYKKPLPTGIGEEDILVKFYEEKEIGSPKKEMVISSIDRERYIAKLESEVRNYQVSLVERDAKLKAMEEEKHASKLSEVKEEASDRLLEIETLENQVKVLTEELEKAHNQAEELQELLILTNNKYIELQNHINTSNTLKQANKQIADLQQQLTLHQNIDHTLRFKAGQLFLDTINRIRQNKEQQVKDEVGEYDPIDDYAINRLQKLIEGNPPSLQQRLLNIDNTGVITLGQFTKFLELLQVPPQDVMTLVKIAHLFEESNGKIVIKDFVDHINKRHMLREEWEKKLLERLLNLFKQTNLDIGDIFAFFDNNKDGTIDFEELVTAFNTLKITLPRQDLKAIFALLDKDMNGTISLEEFEDKLVNYNTHT